MLIENAVMLCSGLSHPLYLRKGKPWVNPSVIRYDPRIVRFHNGRPYFQMFGRYRFGVIRIKAGSSRA